MEILAVIPARGGSKGLIKKNILPISGHSLLAYSIKAAHDSKLITRTVVNTDADYIAEEAMRYNVEVPFMRPSNFAGDFSTDFEVFYHMLNWMKVNEGYVPDLVVQLRPTSPVRPVGIIDECIVRMKNSDADSIRVVTKAPITPYKMWRFTSEAQPMEPLLKIEGMDEPYNQPRQTLPEVYWQIGCLDVIRSAVITEQHSMSGKKILPYVISQKFAVDIDDMDSFKRAEKVLNEEDCIRFP